MPLTETVGRSVLRCCTDAATAWQTKPESKMYHFILASDVCVRMNERLEAESTTTWNERPRNNQGKSNECTGQWKVQVRHFSGLWNQKQGQFRYADQNSNSARARSPRHPLGGRHSLPCGLLSRPVAIQLHATRRDTRLTG